MAIKSIPLSHLKADLERTLNECAESGEPMVVELPGHRFLTIQLLESVEDDTLVDELLESNAEFRALVASSKSSPRKPFSLGSQQTNGES